MEKYYTPEIEEFYVGFEFERAILDCNWTITGWQKDEFTQETDFSALLGYTSLQRVKYLDAEDIENLGFTLKVTDCGEDTEEYPDIYNNDSALGSYHKDSITNIELFGSYYTIKNKSELIKLLKQLGVK